MGVYRRGEVYWIDWRAYGMRYRVAVGTNAKEAAKALDRIKGRVATGEWRPEELEPEPPPDDPRPLFGKALDLYIASRLDKGKGADSYKRLEGDWRGKFEDRRLSTITGEEIESALAHWTETRGWAPATRNNALAQLSGFLTWCMRRKDNGRRWIDHHPIRDGGPERVAVDNARGRWLRPDEIERLRAAAPAWLAEIIVFACSIGMRLSEVCSLTFASYQKDSEGRPFLMTEKTKNGERLAWPLEGPVKDLVEARAKECRFPGDRLLPGPTGGSALKGIRRELPAVVKKAGLVYGRKDPQGITFHVFRHSMASLAINGGVPASVVQKMGNWKTRSMLDRYAHLADETMREAAATVARLVARGHTVVTTAKKPRARRSQQKAVSA